MKKEIPCEQCEKLFKSKANQSEHVKNVYGENISCLSCKKKFASKNYLKKHQKVVHSKENKLICCYCDKTFHFEHSLKYTKNIVAIKFFMKLFKFVKVSIKVRKCLNSIHVITVTNC